MEDTLSWHSKNHPPIQNVFSMGEIRCPICDSNGVETSGCYSSDGGLSDRVKLVKCKECEKVFVSVQLDKS